MSLEKNRRMDVAETVAYVLILVAVVAVVIALAIAAVVWLLKGAF